MGVPGKKRRWGIPMISNKCHFIYNISRWYGARLPIAERQGIPTEKTRNTNNTRNPQRDSISTKRNKDGGHRTKTLIQERNYAHLGIISKWKKKFTNGKSARNKREDGEIYAGDTKVLPAICLPRDMKTRLRNYGIVTKGRNFCTQRAQVQISTQQTRQAKRDTGNTTRTL